MFRLPLPEPINYVGTAGDFVKQHEPKYVEFDPRFTYEDAQNVHDVDRMVCQYENKHYEKPHIILLGLRMFLSMLRHVNNDGTDSFCIDKDEFKGIKFQLVPSMADYFFLVVGNNTKELKERLKREKYGE